MTFILFIIYAIFVGYGAPGSFIGSAWPAICEELPFDVSYAGYISMTIAIGVVLANLVCDRALRKMGTPKFVICGSIFAAIGLGGFSFCSTLPMLTALSLVYGFGSGCTDVALNNYVAIHYSSRSMNWLHFAWGMGSTLGAPLVGWCIATNAFGGWRLSYRLGVGIMLLVIVIVLLTMKKWAKTSTEAVAENKEEGKEAAKALSIGEIFKIKGAPYAFITMFCYCAIEQSSALWASTYLAQNRGIAAATAATWAGFFWSGITFGRLGCGFIANKLGDKLLIRAGVITILVGAVLILVPFGVPGPALAGMLIAGIGCAPVYPCVMHILPVEFGEEKCQSILPICAACANSGSIFIPVLLGLVASVLGIGIFPYAVLIFGILLILVSERMHSLIKKAKLEAQAEN